jgi:hypothetical protein
VRVEKLGGLVARLHAHPRRRLTLLVGVDGPPGSGKTTLACALANLDPGIERVEMEDFRLGAQGPPADEVAPLLDWRRMRSQVLLPLSRDIPGRYQPWRPEAGRLDPWRELQVGGIVVVEGRYALIKQLVTFYDFRIWVDAPPEVRRARLASRDGGTEGAYITSEDPARTAHLRIDGSAPVDPAVNYVRGSPPAALRPPSGAPRHLPPRGGEEGPPSGAPRHLPPRGGEEHPREGGGI